MWDKLKGAGGLVLVIGGLILALLLIGVLIRGGAWVSAKVYPWLQMISAGNFILLIFLFLPLSFFSRTRVFAGNGMIIASYIFGATLWVWGFLVTYLLWGVLGVAIGLLFIGIGVVPIAMLASLFNGMWSVLVGLLVLTVFVFATRTLGFRVLRKAALENLQGL